MGKIIFLAILVALAVCDSINGATIFTVDVKTEMADVWKNLFGALLKIIDPMEAAPTPEDAERYRGIFNRWQRSLHQA